MTSEPRPDPPLVGVSTSEVRTRKTLKPVKHGEPTPSEFALGVMYVRAIEMAGGLPVIVPPLGDTGLERLLDSLDGVCLPGGPDLDPALYGAEAHPELGPVNTDVDLFELRLVRLADERRLPILAICRGAQALNISRGGTLIQHLPDLESAVAHRQSAPGYETSHAIEIEPGTLIERVVGASRIEVNSFHHQGIDRLGKGLRGTAFAEDGTIESLEAMDRDFCIGVQWHAETLVNHMEQVAVFAAFVDACAATAAPGKTFVEEG